MGMIKIRLENEEVIRRVIKQFKWQAEFCGK